MKKYKIFDESFEDKNSEQISELSALGCNLGTTLKPVQNIPTENKLIKNNNNIEINQPQIKQEVKVLYSNSNEKQNDKNIRNNLDNDDFVEKKSEGKNLKNNEFSETSSYHHVQIVDEDVENFKRKLDILVTNFRTDTLKEFMGIKRNLLIEQRSVIESEKQKCDALVYAKVDEVEHLKDNLTKVKYNLNKQTEINDKMSSYVLKLKQLIKERQMKKDIFGKMKNYYLRKKKGNKNLEKIGQFKIENYKKRAFKALMTMHQQEKILKITELKDKECQDKINDLGKNYNKEITDLRRKLEEANKLIEKYKENKNMLQDNLKKALMRGVVAMNLEAMSILEPDQEGQLNALQSMINLNNITSNTTQIPNNNNNNLSKTDAYEYKNRDNYENKSKNNQVNLESENTNNEINNSFELEEMEKKIIDKDNNWINASSVPLNMKNNLIIKENNNNLKSSILEEDQIEQPKFNAVLNNKLYMNSSNYQQNTNLIYGNNNVSMKIPSYNQNVSITDELTKNMNFLKCDVESMISYSNNKSYIGDNDNIYTSNIEPKENYEIENPLKNNKVKVINHNQQQVQTKVVNENKVKMGTETKDKKKLSTTGANITTTSSRKNLVSVKKK